MEPEELRAEQRWSSIPQHSAPNGYWAKHLDEKLLVLVTNATASGDRFPVGVNWLDISRSIGYSPVECLKRYAFLHNARERLSIQGESAAMDRAASRTENTITQHDEDDEDDAQADDANNPFSGMSSSDDLGSPSSRAFLEYGSPITSPRLHSLENSGEFGVNPPDSPPPFAVRGAYKGGARAVTSPPRWESLAKETYSSSPPVLSAPPHVLRQQQHLRTSFGVVGDADESVLKQSTFTGVHSPRIIHGTQHHSRFTDPNFAAEIVNDAFRGLRLGEDLPPPAATSPRMARAISNSEFPFLSDDDRKSKPVVATLPVRIGARLGSEMGPPKHLARHLSVPQNIAQMAASPGSPMLASFQTDNPFSESLTQSALEEAFLDMAGSRLDASSMLFASRYAASQSRVMNDPTLHNSASQRDPSSLSRRHSWKPSQSQQRQ